MQEFREGLTDIGNRIAQTGADYAEPQSLSTTTIEQLQTIISGLRQVPVKVDINVVPVQDDGESIESIEKRAAPIDIHPDVTQGD